MNDRWEEFCDRIRQAILASGGNPDEIAHAHLVTPDALVQLAAHMNTKTFQYLHPQGEAGDFDLLGRLTPTEVYTRGKRSD